jgi:excisionase family DNA binding protein
MKKQIGQITVFDLYELSQELKISLRTLRRYCKEGKLPAQKIGTRWVVSESGLEMFLQGGQKAAS